MATGFITVKAMLTLVTQVIGLNHIQTVHTFPGSGKMGQKANTGRKDIGRGIIKSRNAAPDKTENKTTTAVR